MDPRLLLIFLAGFVGGTGAFFIGAPMPYMLGGIFGAASFVLWYERGGAKLPQVTRWVRLLFMAIIGSMIGSRFTPEILALLPQFWYQFLRRGLHHRLRPDIEHGRGIPPVDDHL